MLWVVALVLAVAQASAGGAAASGGQDKASLPTLPMTTIDEGTLSGIDEPRQVVVRNEAEWEALWREHAPERERPRVDFKQSTVLAVFLGSRATAGWSIRVTSVLPEGDGVGVVSLPDGPRDNQMVAQILTTPFHIVSVPRFDGPATFRSAR